MVAAFVQGQPRSARIQHVKRRRQQRCSFAFEQQRAAGEQRGFIAAQVLRQRGQIDLGQFGFGRNDPVQQLPVIGQQQQARGVAIQPSHGGQRRATLAVAWWKQIEHHPPRILGRTGDAGGFIEHQQHAARRIQHFAVNANAGVIDRIIGVQHVAIGVGDAAFAKQPLHVPAAAITEVGKVLDQLHAFTASMILNPPSCATLRTCAKPLPSASS